MEVKGQPVVTGSEVKAEVMGHPKPAKLFHCLD